jgi:hypothetical protein
MSLAKGLPILLMFTKNQLFVSLICCIVIFISNSLIFVLIFIISMHWLLLGLAYSCFFWVAGASSDYLFESFLFFWCVFLWIQSAMLRLLCCVLQVLVSCVFILNLWTSYLISAMTHSKHYCSAFMSLNSFCSFPPHWFLILYFLRFVLWPIYFGKSFMGCWENCVIF